MPPAPTKDNYRAWLAVDPQQAMYAAEAYYRIRVNVARTDPNEFMELVLRDEESGDPVTQAPVHEEFQRLCNDHGRMIIWSHVESGKSMQVAVGRVLWELGRNPALRIAIVTSVQRQATRTIQALQQYIEKKGPLHDVFPKLGRGHAWSKLSFSIARDAVLRDPSVQVVTLGSGAITGSRIDLVILDDILTYANTRTEDQRKATLDWYTGLLSGRFTNQCRVWALGNAFHPDDLYHILAKNPRFVWRKYPVIDDEGRSNWPSQCPL